MVSNTLIARIVGVPFLILVPLVGSAWAECAWVLWSGNTTREAYKSRQECEKARKDSVAINLLLKNKKATAEQLAEALAESSLECLPDSKITETPSVCRWVWWKDSVAASKSKPMLQALQECVAIGEAANQALGEHVDCVAFIRSTLLKSPTFEIKKSVLNTFNTYEQCKGRVDIANAMKKEETWGLTYCLPETVDPRSPRNR
jgi:hypothetical protein